MKVKQSLCKAQHAQMDCVRIIKTGGRADSLSRSLMLLLRIVGGCLAGHVPWYVFFWLEERAKCGGALINKVWVLSAAHCFCEKFPCSRVKDGKVEKWRIDYNISDFSKIQVLLIDKPPAVDLQPLRSSWELMESLRTWLSLSTRPGGPSSEWWSWWSTTSGRWNGPGAGRP